MRTATKRDKTARKKSPTQAPNVEPAVVGVHSSNQSGTPVLYVTVSMYLEQLEQAHEVVKVIRIVVIPAEELPPIPGMFMLSEYWSEQP